jgi:hypothetical protein
VTPEATDLDPEMQEQKVWDDCYQLLLYVFKLRNVRICNAFKESPSSP